MKIIHYRKKSTGFMHQWHDYHFVHEWKNAGFEVSTVTAVVTAGVFDEQRTLLNIEAELSSSVPNLFFCTTGDDFMSQPVLAALRCRNVSLVRLACDDLSVPFMSKKTAKFYDVYWTTCPENTSVLKSYGARCLVMPFAANPFNFRCVSQDRLVPGTIGFIGTPYGVRAKNLSLLAEDGLNVHIYANSCKSAVPNDQTDLRHSVGFRFGQAKRLASSMAFQSGRAFVLGSILSKLSVRKVATSPKLQYLDSPSFLDFSSIASSLTLSFGSTVLNNTHVLKNPLHNIRLREFEIAACGGCHLVDRSQLLAEYFDDSTEMLMYSSVDEMLDKARFYLKKENIKLRNKIANAARKRVADCHTWSHRLSKIRVELGQ